MDWGLWTWEKGQVHQGKECLIGIGRNRLKALACHTYTLVWNICSGNRVLSFLGHGLVD